MKFRISGESQFFSKLYWDINSHRMCLVVNVLSQIRLKSPWPSNHKSQPPNKHCCYIQNYAFPVTKHYLSHEITIF